MRYISARRYDIANGPGVRVSFWVSGCNRHCKNCFNPEAWDYNAGKEVDDAFINKLISCAVKPMIRGISILGGEPLDQDETIIKIIDMLNEQVQKPIWVWTGYKIEELGDYHKNIVKRIDTLIDGPYIEDLKDPNLKFRGSSNQRIIDIKSSIVHNKIILRDIN